MNTPSPADIRARSELLTARYPEPQGSAAADPLATLIEEAAPLVMALTARRFDDIEVDAAAPMGCPWEPVPGYLEPAAARAVTSKVEALALGTGRKARQSELGAVRLRSFTAGPYSETYFGPEDAAKLKRLDPSALVHEALWALATTCAQRAWLVLWGEAKTPAAGGVKTLDYGRRTSGY